MLPGFDAARTLLFELRILLLVSIFNLRNSTTYVMMCFHLNSQNNTVSILDDYYISIMLINFPLKGLKAININMYIKKLIHGNQYNKTLI